MSGKNGAVRRSRPTVRGVKGSIPRAFSTHNSPDGRAYGRYVRALRLRFGPLPPSADPTLREVGRLSVELAAMGLELEDARARSRSRDASRLRRQMVPMRTQLITLERRLEEIARSAPPSFADFVNHG